MATDNTGRKHLIGFLGDVYALEAHLVQVLTEHAKDAQDVPQVHQKIEQHLQQTELHRDRIGQRLDALGASKPGMKTSLSTMLGQLVGSIAGSRSNTLAKNARDEYVSEQLEIASYIELITVAQAVGDVDTVRTAQLNLQDELAAQQWLIQHLPETVIMSLQQEGVRVENTALPSVQNILAGQGVGAFGQQPFGTTGQPPPYQLPQQPTNPVV